MKVFKLISISLLVINISCSDHLDVEPTSVITQASFWKTESDAQGALAGMYVALRNRAAFDLYYLGEARSEILQLGTVGEGGWSNYYLNTLNSTDAGPSWQGFYTTINAANLILKYVPDIEFASEENKNNILAQAYAMRAYVYFVMVKSWGELPIRTEPTEGYDAETTQKERSSVEEVFSLIKSDLDLAIQLFSDNTYPGERNMWSLPATNSLKAEVYLWTGKRLDGGNADFTTALEALNSIEESEVSLLSDYSDIFDYSNKGNEEIIMSITFGEFEGSNNYVEDMYIIGVGIPANISPEVREFIGPVGAGNNIVVPTQLIKDQFELNDSRREASFYEIFTEDGVYTTTIVVKNRGVEVSGDRLYRSDIILFRYADVLLMKAEAKNALDQDPSIEINMVRERAFGSSFPGNEFLNGSKSENDEAILKERLLELSFEGKRWWDLVRFDKTFELVPTLQDQAGQDYLLLFPISDYILSLENKIVQNPGY